MSTSAHVHQPSTPTMPPAMPPLPFGQDVIKQCIPHREPFLLVDGVTELEPRVSIKAYKDITETDIYMQGHFPGRPIMPGVLQIEALAQAGGIVLGFMPEGQSKLFVFAGLDNVRFRRLVVPGERLDLHVSIAKLRLPIVKCSAIASVNGEVSVEADMMFSAI